MVPGGARGGLSDDLGGEAGRVMGPGKEQVVVIGGDESVFPL